MTLLGTLGKQNTVPVPSTASYILFGLTLLVFITFGLVNVGTTYIIRNLIRGEQVYVMGDFWYAIKKNWKQGIIFGIIDLLLIAILMTLLFVSYFSKLANSSSETQITYSEFVTMLEAGQVKSVQISSDVIYIEKVEAKEDEEQKKNPFNGGITRFAVEQMIGQYFTYVQCLEKKPMFAKQCFFNAKRFYHSCYKDFERHIDNDILKMLYTAQNAAHSQDMIGIIPEITFFEFMEKVRTEEFGGKSEFEAIREELPEWVKELDLKSGVFGEEGYILTDNEEK